MEPKDGSAINDSHHSPQSKHQRLKHGVAAAERAGHPVVVVEEVISGDDFPHFLRKLFKRYARAQMREITLPAQQSRVGPERHYSERQNKVHFGDKSHVIRSRTLRIGAVELRKHLQCA